MTQTPKRALVIDDGATASALAGCRALSDDGWSVGLGAPDRSTLTRSSRSVSAFHLVRSPEQDPDGFIKDVTQAILSGRYEVVFGTSDPHVLTLSERREDVGAIVPYAEHDVVLRTFDKLEMVRAAERSGMGAPSTEVVSPELLASTTFPVVVKARLQWANDPEESALLHTAIARDRVEAEGLIEDIRRAGQEPLLQEMVTGGLMAFGVVVDREGNIVARQQQHSPRIYPPLVGSSARAVTDAIEEGLSDAVDRFVTDVGWFGLAELQFLRGADGVPRLIDVNGRFYGSMPLATGAGCNLAAAWAALATEREITSPARARVGARFQTLDSDVRRAFEERQGGLMRDLAGTIAFAPRAAHGTWSNRDPVPAIRLFFRSVWRVLRKVVRRWSPRSSTT